MRVKIMIMIKDNTVTYHIPLHPPIDSPSVPSQVHYSLSINETAILNCPSSSIASNVVWYRNGSILAHEQTTLTVTGNSNESPEGVYCCLTNSLSLSLPVTQCYTVYMQCKATLTYIQWNLFIELCNVSLHYIQWNLFIELCNVSLHYIQWNLFIELCNVSLHYIQWNLFIELCNVSLYVHYLYY